MQVRLISFGYSNGQPHDTIHNFNLRKLPNPSKELKSKHTGLYKSLQEELFAMPVVLEKFTYLCNQLEHYLLECESDSSEDSGEEKEILSFGFGCFSGKHRSVAIVERLTQWANQHEQLRSQYKFCAQHRDINLSTTQKASKHSKRVRKDKNSYVQ